MENIIKQRDQDMNMIADIMKDINFIAKDVLNEVKEGKKKLEDLSEFVQQADQNGEKALSELK